MEKDQKQVKMDRSPENKNNKNDDSTLDNPNQNEYDKIDNGSEKQQRSVFISNLDYCVTEDQLKEFLGLIEELRLLKDKKGISRGFAYCVFATVEEAQKTLKRDRELLNSRPVFISKYNVDKTRREHNFRFQTTRENNKLFVKGLPLTMTQEEVEELFKQYGEITDVRLVTLRNGRPRGLAYIDFKNETDAAKAIIAIDNTDIQGFTISVAISDPPKRKFDNNYMPAPAPYGARKNRLQIPLVPRSIQTQVTKPVPSKSSMTNDDFRKMLNKKI